MSQFSYPVWPDPLFPNVTDPDLGYTSFVMAETTRYLTTEVIQNLTREIEENGGAELFAVLSKDSGEELYSRITVVCRGTQSEVPVLLSRAHPGEMTVHNHPSGELRPSQADMHIAHLFGEEGIGSMIVNNDVSQCIVVAEPSEEARIVDVDQSEVEAIFSERGPLGRQLTGYESRQSQVDMAVSVTEAMNSNRILAVEAGTGTGKSLAYLVPALLWARHNKGRVVIATKTIALQEQLVFKDIPLARSLFQDPPQASLVKGRNNYVCLRKLQDVSFNQMSLFNDGEKDLEREIRDLQDWMEQDGSGDRADLAVLPSHDAWDMVRSDADMCLGIKCPHFQRSPFYDSRRKAAQSKILVVNQALLFSDLALREATENYTAAAVIPAYDHIILDEAHSVEDIATDHFGQKLSSFALRLMLNKYKAAGKGRGALSRLFHSALETKSDALVKVLEETLLPQFEEQRAAVTEQLYALSAALHELWNPENRRQMVVWLKSSLLDSQQLDPARQEAKQLMQLMHQLLLTLRRIRSLSEDRIEESEKFKEKTRGLMVELDARNKRLEAILVILANFAVKGDENQVPWLELRKVRQFDEFEYRVSPLNVAPMLRKALFKPFKSVVMTSATLDLNDNFNFLASRNGLNGWEEKQWDFKTFPSPFDYRVQSCLFSTRMLTDPNHREFLDELADIILRTAFSGYPGGTLVLFTSYNSLNAIAQRIEEPLARAGVDLLVQGKANRHALVQRMKETQGILLGTDSFWEGVDLPGLALTKVIITKLPFRQIGDPIFEARCAAIEASGRSSFKDYSLPLALLKFKQGAGRLIRNRSDRGVLIVTDNRIRSKYYGRQFINLVKSYPFWELNAEELSRSLSHTGEVV